MTYTVSYQDVADVDPGDVINIAFPFTSTSEVLVYADGTLVASSHYTWTGAQQVTAGSTFPANTSVRVRRVTNIDSPVLQPDQGYFDADASNITSLRAYYRLQELNDSLGVIPSLVDLQAVADQATSAASALPWVSITAKGAVTNAADISSSLQAVVNTSKFGYIPPGIWKWSTPPTSASKMTWMIAPDAYFPLLPTKGPFGQTDLSSLGGRIMRYANADITFAGMRYGDPDPWPEEYRPYSVAISEFSVVSPTGEIAVSGWSRASDHPTVNQGTIGGEFAAVNDDLVYKKPVFGTYIEVWRTDPAVGAALNEFEAINLGNVVDLSPISNRGGINAEDTISFVAASGGEIAGAQPASAAYAMWANGSTFRFGYVCRKDSLDPSGDLAAFSMPNNYDVAWYSLAGGKIAHERAGSGSRMTQNDTAATGYTQTIRRRLADNASNTRSLDTIFRANYYGYGTSADYLGAWTQVLQRTAFSGGTARFSMDFTAMNTDGSSSQITLNGLVDKSFDPYPTSAIGLGSTVGYWLHVTSGHLRIVDGITAPGTVSGFGCIYIDSADGDLKIKFGDGTVKTIVVDT